MKAKTLKLTPDMLSDLNLIKDGAELGMIFKKILIEHKTGVWEEMNSAFFSRESLNVYASIKAKIEIYRKSNKALMSYRLDKKSIKSPQKKVERVFANSIGRSFGDLVVTEQDGNLITAKSKTTGKEYTYNISLFETGRIKGAMRNKNVKSFNAPDNMKGSIAFDLFYKKLYLGFFLKHYRSTALALPFHEWSQYYFTKSSEIQFKLMDENGIPQKYWQYYAGYKLDSQDPESQTPALELFDSPSYDHFAIPVYSESRLNKATKNADD